MALVLADRVQETTTTTGTGTVTLNGAVSGFQSFSAVGNGNTTYYTIADQTGTNWEVGLGTYTASGTTLSRDSVLSSSNSGSLVNFGAGTKNVFVTYPASKAVYNGGALGTPLSGTVTNLTGTASININGTVGATTANTGAFTTLSASSTVSGAGFSTYLASPPAIGGTAAAAGSFTTLSASSTVSGTGFSTYLASPPAIGGTAAAAGTFTTLTANGNTTLGDATTDTITLTGTVQPGVVISGSSSGDALRITQTGAGNALLVEDAANPDSTPFVVDASGNVGIGTSSPTSKLTIGTGTYSAAASGTTGMYTVAAGLEMLSDSYFFGTRTGGILMLLNSSGNLGLGVTPSAWYSTVKAYQFSTSGALWGLSGQQNVLFSNNEYLNGSAVSTYIATGYASRYQQIDGSHRWYTAPSGTANTTTITNGVSYTIITSGNQTSFGAANNNVGTVFTATSSGTLSSGTVSQNITFTQAMTLDASGNLLVGATTAGYSAKSQFVKQGSTSSNNSVTDSAVLVASANGNAGENIGLRLKTGAGISGTTFAGQLISLGNNIFEIYTAGASPLVFGTDATERARITGGGEVYIAGTTDQGAYNLQVNGTGVWGAGAYVNGSDERLKDNIQTLNDGLAVVSQLRPVTFQYKPEHSKDQSVQPGFIAQELQQAMDGKAYLDGVVQSGPEYLNVAYQNLIPILTKAIQEQQALITSLTARVAALEGTQP